MQHEEERMRILEMIDSGKISADEGFLLLKALSETDESSANLDEGTSLPDAPALMNASVSEQRNAGVMDELPPPSFSAPPTSASSAKPQAEAENRESVFGRSSSGLPADAAKWRRWWTIPLWIGAGIVILGALAMYWAVKSAGAVNLWLLCASVPFTIGVLLLALAWQSRHSPWLHLRVQQPPGETPQRIALSFPIPVGVTVWFLRTFGNRIPGLQDQPLDEIIQAVSETTRPDNPLYIQVDEGEHGNKVEIFIG